MYITFAPAIWLFRYVLPNRTQWIILFPTRVIFLLCRPLNPIIQQLSSPNGSYCSIFDNCTKRDRSLVGNQHDNALSPHLPRQLRWLRAVCQDPELIREPLTSPRVVAATACQQPSASLSTDGLFFRNRDVFAERRAWTREERKKQEYDGRKRHPSNRNVGQC